MMTAVITIATLGGPIGLFAAGPLLEALGPRPVLGIAAAGMTVAALAFATVALRHRGSSGLLRPRRSRPGGGLRAFDLILAATAVALGLPLYRKISRFRRRARSRRGANSALIEAPPARSELVGDRDAAA